MTRQLRFSRLVRLASRILPVKVLALVCVVLLLGFTTAFIMKAAVEDKLLLLESLILLLEDVDGTP